MSRERVPPSFREGRTEAELRALESQVLTLGAQIGQAAAAAGAEEAAAAAEAEAAWVASQPARIAAAAANNGELDLFEMLAVPDYRKVVLHSMNTALRSRFGCPGRCAAGSTRSSRAGA